MNGCDDFALLFKQAVSNYRPIAIVYQASIRDRDKSIVLLLTGMQIAS
ncbi:MAG: hypothetical protein J7647_21060 [Cyanobacteria bacterium SBLK]|nr:hypothetical protein [Cyanobacteria bacterium SBLK]